MTNNFLYERIIVWFRNYTLQRDFISEILNRQKSNRQNGAVAGDLQWCYVIGYCTYVNSVNSLSFACLLDFVSFILFFHNEFSLWL